MPRLLFDENLSPSLPARLTAAYPNSCHVRDLGLRGAADRVIWARAASDGYVLVSKDDDFRQLSFLYGPPPKVVWLVVGNAGTGVVARLLMEKRPVVEAFVASAEEALLLLRLPHGS